MNQFRGNSIHHVQPNGWDIPVRFEITLRIFAQPETATLPVHRDTPTGSIQQFPPRLKLLHQPFVALTEFLIESDHKVLKPLPGICGIH